MSSSSEEASSFSRTTRSRSRSEPRRELLGPEKLTEMQEKTNKKKGKRKATSTGTGSSTLNSENQSEIVISETNSTNESSNSVNRTFVVTSPNSAIKYLHVEDAEGQVRRIPIDAIKPLLGENPGRGRSSSRESTPMPQNPNAEGEGGETSSGEVQAEDGQGKKPNSSLSNRAQVMNRLLYQWI